MTPKIIFRYSHIYDVHWKLVTENNPLRKRLQKEYPSSKTTLQYIRKIATVWGKKEKEYLQTLSSLTRLKWNRKEIHCYVVGFCRPFSDPLTIRPYKNNDNFIDTLIHELVHNLLALENNLEKGFKYFQKKYKEETKLTINHIPVDAILGLFHLKMFGEKRLEKVIQFDSKSPEYKRAWEIAKKEGFENIIEKIKK